MKMKNDREEPSSRKGSWNIQASSFAVNSINPIRQIVENMNVNPNPSKPLIPLSIGDPTLFGNLKPPDIVSQSLIQTITSGSYNGYLPSTGLESAREAVAAYVSVPGALVDAADVFLTSGASHALELCISLLASPGSNILIPRPGFPLYRTLCGSMGIQIRSYDLIPDQEWQVDLSDMRSKIDHKTVAIIYNNPSNPCGSVYGGDHIRAILDVAADARLPIIADEIYENMVFPGHSFIPIASLTSDVPVLSCRGTTKRFLVPGFRLGWITLHDQQKRFGPAIRNALNQLCQRIMGPNSIIQGSLKAILTGCPESFFHHAISVVKENASFAFDILNKVPGLRPVKPSGAMYIMVGIEMHHFPSFSSGLQLIEVMVSEESVFCLPGECFDYPNYMRMVLTVPKELIIEACSRIEEFFHRHYVPDSRSNSHHRTANGQEDKSSIKSSDTSAAAAADHVIKCLPVAGT